MTDKVRDLRSALKRLKAMPGQLITTEVEVDPMAELAGVYRQCGSRRNCDAPYKGRFGYDI